MYHVTGGKVYNIIQSVPLDETTLAVLCHVASPIRDKSLGWIITALVLEDGAWKWDAGVIKLPLLSPLTAIGLWRKYYATHWVGIG